MDETLKMLRDQSNALHEKWMAEAKLVRKYLVLMNKAGDRRAKAELLSKAWKSAHTQSGKWFDLSREASERRIAIGEQIKEVDKKANKILKKLSARIEGLEAQDAVLRQKEDALHEKARANLRAAK